MQDHMFHMKRHTVGALEAYSWCGTNIDGSSIEIMHFSQEQIKDISAKTAQFMMLQIKDETDNCTERANLPHSGVGRGQKRLRRMCQHIEDSDSD